MTSQVQPSPPADLGWVDLELVTPARGAQGRAGSPQGAAVRDEDRQMYAAATVALPSLESTALQVAATIAVASGAAGAEAAVVLGGQGVDDVSLAVARRFFIQVVILTDEAGSVMERISP